ncbi:enoyl-CoA hydratase/isomerase family protein [Paenactinomyces guangxiensis]|uniref:Enoyl-CoA hydratase/isomerase family protein n=1 Tax=Paenactinomyces guangxiensis TaxID=1490290 RepID=A0A7W2A845_9BACL|nr:enoyl-CoA hydratase/isomerase family protein [Paenactinomyces guangxiensis]MBA4494270.1 enoyl-CoA hydratase/isomerase family protein [Paenactinomyces guangxiensis]MBH8590764.1 enoyl-CoA hydratase/isomerase family protein [Paenactinomyces guangxiensis]
MQTLLVDQQNGIGWIRFNRPEVRNAVNLQMIEELELIIDQWSRDEKIKVIVFKGDERAFVSGGDVEEFHQLTSKQEIYPVMERMGRLLEQVYQLDQITVAAVEGAAVGGGCEIAASCDFCLASDRAKFGMIQVKLGITTGWGGAGRLLHKIGTSRGLELLLTGDRITAQQAKELQLADKLISYENFEAEVATFAKRLADAPAKVMKTYKHIARQVERGVPSSALYPVEAESCSECWETEEHRQAVESFLSRTRGRDTR